VVPTKPSQFVTGQFADAAAKRSVCPTIQEVGTPSPEQPYTNRFWVSMYPRAMTASTPHACHPKLTPTPYIAWGPP
jgi:hypothetical protein